MTNKIQIENQTYYKILMGLLILLLLYNLFVFTQSINLIGALPIVFQSVLLFLLFTKNRYSQMIIKYWIGFICIVLQVIKLGSTLIIAIIDNMQNEENPFEPIFSEYSLKSMALLIFGIVILMLNSDFATIEKESQ